MSSFQSVLDATIAAKPLLSHSFYTRWQKGELSMEELRGYAKEYYSFEKEFNLNIDIESVMYEISNGLEAFVFPEYLNIFKKYGRENIFILTQGDENFQQLKIKHSEVDKKVKEILVVDSTKQEKIEDISLLWPNETILFIDDKFKNLSFETENINIRRIFVSDEENLTKEEKEYLTKHEIPIIKREDLEKV